ncbi:Chitin synthase, class 2, partial [Serendipita sp. 401]
TSSTRCPTYSTSRWRVSSVTSPCSLVPSVLTVTRHFRMDQMARARSLPTSGAKPCTVMVPMVPAFSNAICTLPKIECRSTERKFSANLTSFFSLCFEIVTKKKEGWVLKYVKSAKAATDVPTTIAEFISQRRRWLNGSLFAALHATVYMFRIWTSGQGFFRKLLLQFEFIYNAVQLFFSWTSLANFYLAFYFLVQSATASNDGAFSFMGVDGAGLIIFDVFLKLYIALLFVVTVCSLGNRPQGSNSFLHFEPWHMFTSFLQYMFLLPSYVNILMMYAMCNLHDVSWGTKGDNGSAKDLGGAKKVANKDGEDMYEVELPTAREDVDSVWAASRNALRNKPKEEKQHRDAATKQADHDRNSRTNTVLAWVGTNMILILLFTSAEFQKVRLLSLGAVEGWLTICVVGPQVWNRRLQPIPQLPVLRTCCLVGHPLRWIDTLPHPPTLRSLER